MEKSNNRVFPLRVPGVFEFTSAVATGTSKALAGQLSPQAALDEVAKEWEAIVSRVGKKAVQKAYAVGVKMEDNELQLTNFMWPLKLMATLNKNYIIQFYK